MTQELLAHSRPQAWSDSALPPLDDPDARTRLAAVNARLYKWPPTFAGYQARLFVNDDGVLYQGQATVLPRQQTVVRCDGPDALQTWVRERLWTQALHLADIPFSEGDGRYGIMFASDREEPNSHPRGRQFVLRGGPMPSRYRVKEDHYTQIERCEAGGERRINTIERYETAPDGRPYATHYVITYFSESGRNPYRHRKLRQRVSLARRCPATLAPSHYGGDERRRAHARDHADGT